MTIAEQLKVMLSAAQSWAQSNGGWAQVASDQVHLIDLLRTRPGGVFAGLMFDTEDVRGEYDELGRVDRVYKLVVSRGKGFRIESGEALTDGAAGGKPLFDLVEEGRELVRGLRFVDEAEPRPVYRGSGPLEVSGFVLDAYEVRFSIGTQLPLQLEPEPEEE